MTIARSQVVRADEEGVYHCVSRCVRRAFLCGYDKLTRRSFEHRRQWVYDRLKFLVEVFSIEVLAYALMNNHQHTLLRTRPDELKKLKDTEVAARWLRLYPSPESVVAGSDEPSAAAVRALAGNKARIAVLRARLGSISWFMKSLSESIARRANREDECKGRFWEGRFRCQRVVDEKALLACSLYIDLNPIRAKVAPTPELSTYTSAWERIRSVAGATLPKSEPPLWLVPIQDTKSRRGFLRVSLPEYLALLDETGRMIRDGKRGAICEKLAPILHRIGVNPKTFAATTLTLGSSYGSFLGSHHSLSTLATSLHKAWLKGFSKAKVAFA